LPEGQLVLDGVAGGIDAFLRGIGGAAVGVGDQVIAVGPEDDLEFVV
jgi:hypothetical protein